MLIRVYNFPLDDANLVCNVKSIVVCCQSDISLLQTIGPNQGVDLIALDVVHLLHSILDLALVCPHIHHEHEGVVVLNLLHGRLSGQGELQHLWYEQRDRQGNRIWVKNAQDDSAVAAAHLSGDKHYTRPNTSLKTSDTLDCSL